MSEYKDILEGKITPAIWRLAMPLMITSFIEMAYNLTDMMWIGQINGDAVSAVGIVGFLLWIGTGLTLITKTGMGVLTAQAYGSRDIEKTKAIVASGLQLTVVISIITIIFFEIILEPFVNFYQLGDAVYRYSMDYGRVGLLWIVFSMLNYNYSQAYQSLGNSKIPLYINSVGLIANMILDPIFIFGFGIIPQMGIFGAAFASVISQAIVAAIFIYSFRYDRQILGKIRFFQRPDLKIWKHIFRLGIFSAAISIVHACVSLWLNKLIAQYGSIAVAVSSVGSQFESLAWMSAEGFAVALTTMVAQNYGAKKIHRVKESMNKGLTSIALMGAVATAVLILCREPLYAVFLPGEPNAILYGGWYLLIFASFEVFVTVDIGSAACFNGIGMTHIPSWVSQTLNLLRIPMAYLLMPVLGVYGVWLAMGVSSALKGTINFSWLKWEVWKRNRTKGWYAEKSVQL